MRFIVGREPYNMSMFILYYAGSDTDQHTLLFSQAFANVQGAFTSPSNSSNPLGLPMFNFYADPTTECLAKTSNIAQIIFSGAFTIVVSFYTRIMCRYVHIMFRCATVYERSVYKSNSCVEWYPTRSCLLNLILEGVHMFCKLQLYSPGSRTNGKLQKLLYNLLRDVAQQRQHVWTAGPLTFSEIMELNFT